MWPFSKHNEQAQPSQSPLASVPSRRDGNKGDTKAAPSTGNQGSTTRLAETDVGIAESSIVEILLICQQWVPDEMQKELPITAFEHLNGWQPRPLPAIRFVVASDVNTAIHSVAHAGQGKSYFIQPGELPPNPATGLAPRFALITVVNDISGKVVFLSVKLTRSSASDVTLPTIAAQPVELPDENQPSPEESDMPANILMQQHDKSCVTAVSGSVPVITTINDNEYMYDFEAAFAVNFLRAGCPAVQFFGKREEKVLESAKTAQSKFDRIALPGETFRVTATGSVLVVTRHS